MQHHINNGWGKTVLSDPQVLALAFSETVTRTPDRGRFTYKAPRHGVITFYCGELLGYDRPITVRVPAYRPEVAFCFDGEDFIGMAKPEQTYGLLETAGLIELNRRKKVFNRIITKQKSHVALLSLTDETKRHIGHFPDAPEAPVAAIIDAPMLGRMAKLQADDVAAQIAERAGKPKPENTISQWKTGENARLKAVTFEEEDSE